MTRILSNLAEGPVNDISKGTIKKACRGDGGACEEIYKGYSGLVFSVALRITADRSDAEEVAQETFIKVFSALPDFRFRSSIKSWIYRIAVNTALNFMRGEAKKRQKKVTYDDDIFTPQKGNNPASGLERKENEKAVRTLLGRLNPDFRACIVLRDIEGLSYKEISSVLNININTVRTRIKRARTHLINYIREGEDHGL